MGKFKMLMGVLALVLLCFSLSPASAASANISHSYKGPNTIQSGSIVSLDSTQTDYVVPSNTLNGSQVLGVVVNSSDSLLAVDAQNGLLQVATSGTVSVLVSTLGGDIKVGDQVSVSPFNGVGMKAVAGSYVVGLAQTNFSSTTPGSRTEVVKDTKGKSQTIAVGYVRMSIAIGSGATLGNDSQLTALQKFAKSLTGHTVSTPRIILSLIITLVASLALIVLIYASIYGSIVSIGRNPLAKFAVFRTLRSVLGMAFLTAGIASITIFFLLR
jgi:hypothetical protein